MATTAATRRLTKEYLAIQKGPPDFLIAKPLEQNILEWHYILTGPPDTPYAGGEYHGRLVFPPEYPFKPPSIYMITPNGRFQTDTRLCLSMSDFHPAHWNPSWSVATILNGLLSFMMGDENTTGSVRTTDKDKQWLAAKSRSFNRSKQRFRDVFPEFCDSIMMDQDITEPSPTTDASANPLRMRNRMASHISAGNTQARAPLHHAHLGQATTAGRRTQFGFSLESWGKWMLLFLVCTYLVVVKLAARAT